MKELKLYYCEHCKKVVDVVVDTPVPLVCCGQKMTEVKPNSTEAAHEKHLPVIEKDGNKVTVKVSTVEHPMQDEHYITAIWLQTEKALYKKALVPGEKTEAVFTVEAGDNVIAAYEYCNLHGLWKTEA